MMESAKGVRGGSRVQLECTWRLSVQPVHLGTRVGCVGHRQLPQLEKRGRLEVAGTHANEKRECVRRDGGRAIRRPRPGIGISNQRDAIGALVGDFMQQLKDLRQFGALLLDCFGGR